MTPLQTATLVILIAATVAGVWRGARLGVSRWVLCLQVVVAVLFYGLLYPPHLPVRGDRLTLFTAAVPLMVALPGADSRASREAVPDLATALRRHAGVRHLHIEGEGLSARDRPAAAKLAVDFAPAPLRGLIELHLPSAVLLGHAWSLRGRVASAASRVELRDPSGAVVDGSGVDAAGRFSLTGVARAAGNLRYELRVLDPRAANNESASVPVSVHDGATMTAILRAGAASPEFKYLRRWATDAGMQLSVSAALTEGVALREGSTQLLPAALAQADLVILDGRAWAALEPEEKAALRAAVDAGLGLLLRADSPLDVTTMQDWRELGFDLQTDGRDAGDAPSTVTLDRRTGMRDRMGFAVTPLVIHAPPAGILLASDEGAPIAWWRSQGQGRVGLSLLLDSYKLVLGGESARYASLWSDMLERLSRPQPAAAPTPGLPEYSWVDQRITLCGLGDAAGVRAPDGRRAALIIDAQGCAAYWPASVGWHALQSHGGDFEFYVRAADDAAGLTRRIDRDATLGLVNAGEPNPSPAASAATENVPLARWPLFAAWLLATSALWWCERRP